MAMAKKQSEYIPEGDYMVKNTGGGGAGSIVWGLGYWLRKIFWGSSKILI